MTMKLKLDKINHILSDDITILLHIDPTEPESANGNPYIIRQWNKVFNSLWEKEKVPHVFKQTLSKDST